MFKSVWFYLTPFDSYWLYFTLFSSACLYLIFFFTVFHSFWLFTSFDSDLLCKFNFCYQYLTFCLSVPVGPIWQLWGVESNLYWEQLERRRVYAEAGVQGLTLKRFTRRRSRFVELSWRCISGGRDQSPGSPWPQHQGIGFCPNTWFNSFVPFYATLNKLNSRCWARLLTWRSSPLRRSSWQHLPGLENLGKNTDKFSWCKISKWSTWFAFSGRTGRPRLKFFQLIR